MKFLYILGLIFVGIAVNAQSNKDLDLGNGLSIFKFGMSARDFNDIEPDTSLLLNGKRFAVYNYNGDSLKNIFNVNVSDVSLLFYQDQLAKIVIKLGTNPKDYTLEEFNRVQEALLAKFGEHTGKLAMSGAVLLGGFRWPGKEHLVEHTRFTSTSTKKKDRWTVGNLSFENKNITHR